jgi:hypothetical protein
VTPPSSGESRANLRRAGVPTSDVEELLAERGLDVSYETVKALGAEIRTGARATASSRILRELTAVRCLDSAVRPAEVSDYSSELTALMPRSVAATA